MRYGLFADVIVLVHLLFVLFVMFGVLFALRWPGAIRMHAPALIWGLIVEFADLTCPLTPLESRLRVAAGEAGSREDFLSQWLVTGFWQCMDTLRDKRQLDQLWREQKAPWRVW